MNAVALTRTGDGTLVVSSETIAHGSGVEHRAVLQLIGNNIADFQEFGQVAFEMRAGYNNSQVRVALLNEQQATLLMTYQRNTDQVRAFKKALVRAFFEMATQVDLSIPRSLPAALRAYALEVEAREAAEQKIALDAPKVAAYDQLMDADGFYTMEAVAKLGGIGRNTLFARLREAGVIQSGSRMPYQRYMHWFKITTSSWTDGDGIVHPTNTTRVLPDALVKVLAKAGVDVAAEVS